MSDIRPLPYQAPHWSGGEWVTVPGNLTRSGKAERRFRQPSGTLMEMSPGWGFVGHQLSKLASNLGIAPGPTIAEQRAGARRGVSGLGADPRIHNEQLSKAQLEALRRGQNEAIAAYGSIPGSSLPPAPDLGAPDAYGDPAARAREAEQRRMMQQYASKDYWDTEQGKAMLGLGQQMTAPKDAKLADYYGAQRAVGIGSMDEILAGLASADDRYKEGGDLRKWAEANQALALREYNKRFPGGSVMAGEGEPTAPTIDTANPTAGERALMEAKYALYGDPSAAPAAETKQTPGGYTPDELVIGMNKQGQETVGEGAYGFDPELDQLPIARPPVQPEAARASNLEPATQTAQQQRADELLKRYKGATRGQLLTGI